MTYTILQDKETITVQAKSFDEAKYCLIHFTDNEGYISCKELSLDQVQDIRTLYYQYKYFCRVLGTLITDIYQKKFTINKIEFCYKYLDLKMEKKHIKEIEKSKNLIKEEIKYFKKRKKEAIELLECSKEVKCSKELEPLFDFEVNTNGKFNFIFKTAGYSIGN